MNIGAIDTNAKVMIIAEVGNNHEGSYTLAEELVGRAAEAGADAVKFQTIVPERLVSAQQTARIEQLKKYQFSYEQFTGLKRTADSEGIVFLSTPFDIESALFLDTIVPAFKIASGDNTFFPLLEAVAKTGKPIIMSAGMTELDEIRKSKEYIEHVWKRESIVSELALLHCVVSYPTPPEEANLLAIQALRALGGTVGYSDHTIGVQAAILSVALGARIIEKHFTVDKNYSAFRDHQLSADPADLEELVQRVREAELLLGEETKRVQTAEAGNVGPVRRSIVAARDLPQGHVLRHEDISWVRPGGGLAPGSEDKILGKSLHRNVQSGEKILADDV